MVNVDLAMVVRHTADSLRLLPLPTEARIEVAAPAELWARGDPTLVLAVAERLAAQQADRLAAGGTIWLSATPGEESLAHLVVEAEAPIPPDEWREQWLPALRDGAASGSPIADLLQVDVLRAGGADVSVGSGDVGTTIVLTFPTTPTARSDTKGGS